MKPIQYRRRVASPSTPSSRRLPLPVDFLFPVVLLFSIVFLVVVFLVVFLVASPSITDRRLPLCVAFLCRVAFNDRSLIYICRSEDPNSQEHQQLLEL
jgi:hypothetical protein